MTVLIGILNNYLLGFTRIKSVRLNRATLYSKALLYLDARPVNL